MGIWVYDSKYNDIEYLEGTLSRGIQDQKKWNSTISQLIVKERMRLRQIVEADQTFRGILDRAVTKQKSTMVRKVNLLLKDTMVYLNDSHRNMHSHASYKQTI